MRKKLIKYRGERASQIAEFEERIKRQFGNTLRSINDEDIRYVESRIRTNNYNLEQKLKEYQDFQSQKNEEILQEIREIKKENKSMKSQVDAKVIEVQNLKNIIGNLIPKLEVNRYQQRRTMSKRELGIRSTKKRNVKKKDIKAQYPPTKLASWLGNRGKSKSYTKLSKNKSYSYDSKQHHKHTLHDQKTSNETAEKLNKDTSQKLYFQLNQISPLKENDKWEIVSNKNLRNYASKYSHDLEISKEVKIDSFKMDNTFGFAIRIEDKLLLYSKDPRLRNIWGNSIGKENKYAKLITDTSARKLFREI